MRELIRRLCHELQETEVWLLTSHDRLVLMNAPEVDEGEWHVMIASYDEETRVNYSPLPEHVIFPHEKIVATAFTPDAAYLCAIVAMLNCGAWPENGELSTKAAEVGAFEAPTSPDARPLWKA